jgi:hypothetical protein
MCILALTLSSYSAHEAAPVKVELERVKEKFTHAERVGKAAEM